MNGTTTALAQNRYNSDVILRLRYATVGISVRFYAFGLKKLE